MIIFVLAMLDIENIVRCVLVIYFFFFLLIYRSVTSFNARSRIVLTISVILEFIIASVSTLAIFDPIGELSLRSCRPRKFKDWYTPLCFKRIAIGEKIRCPQEAIYPLYVLLFHCSCYY